jgi:hypothetical protein
MKKLILAVLILFCCFVANGWATTFIGNISNFLPDNTLVGTLDWSIDTQLSWIVDNTTNTGYWTYLYSFTAPQKDISHGIIEVSSNFSSANIFPGTTMPYFGPTTYSGTDPSNPGMPGSMWGIKWEGFGTWTIVTDRAPMWGDFYAVDGKGDLVCAYNLKFGIDTNALIDNGNAGGWALVPDTDTGVIPEPGTILLLGSGFLGLGLVGYFRRKRT